MARASILPRCSNRDAFVFCAKFARGEGSSRKPLHRLLAMTAFAALLVLPLRFTLAQSSPSVKSVDPTSGKVNDSISLEGENLGKTIVSAVYLSDDKSDYKAVIVQQASDKIVLKIPQVKPGDYNVSIQAGAAIYIQPVRFTVQ
ncbi:MAG TPA: IPT/TIG domain-containing protein [Candidatus Acidoferrales bacterium]